MGGLSHDTSEADFVNYFGIYGQVVDCVIMCDPHTRKPRGFGFITYDNTSAVDRACVNKFHELNGTTARQQLSPAPTSPHSTSHTNTHDAGMRSRAKQTLLRPKPVVCSVGHSQASGWR